MQAAYNQEPKLKACDTLIINMLKWINNGRSTNLEEADVGGGLGVRHELEVHVLPTHVELCQGGLDAVLLDGAVHDVAHHLDVLVQLEVEEVVQLEHGARREGRGASGAREGVPVPPPHVVPAQIPHQRHGRHKVTQLALQPFVQIGLHLGPFKPPINKCTQMYPNLPKLKLTKII
eukprot:1179267-Prorocentrum_minimum.AAC.1